MPNRVYDIKCNRPLQVQMGGEEKIRFCPPLRKSPNFGIMDALGRFEVRERSAAGVQTMWFEPWRPR